MKSRLPIVLAACFACCGSALNAAESPDVNIQALIDAAIAAKQRQVVLPQGTFRLPAGLRVVGAEKLTIDGTGTTLVVTDPRRTGVDVRTCNGVTLRGLTLDYDPLPFTQGSVVAKAADGKSFEFAVHEGYPDLTEEYLVEHVHVFAADKREWKRDVPDVYTKKTSAINSRRGRIDLKASADYADRILVGDRVVLNCRNGSAIRFVQCENVRVEAVKVLTGPGCGVICRYMRGDNQFQFDIYPGLPPKGATQPRLMSTCADGFNYAFARRGPALEKSHFSFMGDDSVNLHGPVLLVVEVVSPTEVLLGSPYGPEPVDWLVERGDSLRCLQASDYAVRGKATIESFVREKTKRDEHAAAIRAFWPRVQSKSRGTLYRTTLREPLAAKPGDVIDIPAINCPGFAIRNCEFHDHRARGILICSPNGVVENNLIRRTKQIGIKLDPGYAFWREAGWVEGVSVRGNVLDDVGQSSETYQARKFAMGAISVCVQKEDPRSTAPAPLEHRKITIENNTIRSCSVAGIYVRAAEDVSVRGNTLSNTNYVKLAPGASAEVADVEGPIDVRHTRGVSVADNRITDVGKPPVQPAAVKRAGQEKRLLLLGAKRDHPPGRHQYMAGLRVLAKCLEGVPGLKTEIVAADEPWPDGPQRLAEADGVLLSLGQGSKWIQSTPQRLLALRDLAERGGGIVALHLAIGGKDACYVQPWVEILGGLHGGPDRRFLVMDDAEIRVIDRQHPITRAVRDLHAPDEFYFRLKFGSAGKVTPLVQVPIEGNLETVAWAYERNDGGRSFGFSGGDPHTNWEKEAYRRLMAQAVLWTLNLPIPEKGLPVKISPDDLRLMKDE